MKPLFKIFLIILVLLVVSGIGGYFYVRYKFQPPANQLVVTGLPAACSFTWKSDITVSPAVAHAALLVPIKLAGCARTCYLQFDTGAPYSLLYANPLAALRAAYPATQQMLLLQRDTVRNLSFTLGRGRVQAARLPVLRYGASQLPADSIPFVIGTLGADVLATQVLIIDYPQRRFTLLPRVPDSLARQTTFVPLDYANRRVLVRAALQGNPQQFLFDSGSSAFSLLTSQSVWQDLGRPAAVPQTTGVNSWGKTLTAHTLPSDASLQFAASSVPLGTVTYIEGTSLWQRALMRFSGMGGMLGNKPFTRHTIILDVQAGRFGLVTKMQEKANRPSF